MKNILVITLILLMLFIGVSADSSLNISSIGNISISIYQYEKFELPAKVTAIMSNNTKQQLSVTWNSKAVDTNKSGTFKYLGTVKSYQKKVLLTLIVKPAPTPVKLNLIPQNLNFVKPISDKLTFRTGVNSDLLFLTAALGGGFQTLPEYFKGNDQYGINESAKKYFASYINNQHAKTIYNTAMQVNNPPKKFIGNRLNETLRYDENMLFNISSETSTTLKTLEKFAYDSKAASFFNDNKKYYENMMNDFTAKINFDYIKRLNEFFGETPKNAQFGVVLSTFINGGQATNQTLKDGTIMYNVIVNPGNSEYETLHVIYHETVHNFYDVRSRRSDYVRDYSRYSDVLGDREYNFADQVNETITEAVTFVLLDKYHPNPNNEINLKHFDQKSLKGIYNIYLLIKNQYLPNRNQYKTFDTFVPVIFDNIKASSKINPLMPIRQGWVDISIE